MRILVAFLFLVLAACGGGSSGDTVSSMDTGGITAAQLAFSTRAGAAQSDNGLAFAGPASAVGDVSGAGPINVKVIQAVTDWDTGTTSFAISDEVLVVSLLDLNNFSVTINGETVTFTDSVSANPNANSIAWESVVDNTDLGAFSGNGTYYSFAGGEDPGLTGEFDTQAFFVYGFETDPAEIAALVGTNMGDVTYSGNFKGFGQIMDTDGAIVQGNVQTSGAINIVADFDDASTVNGTLNGSIVRGTANPAFVMGFSTDIVGNGFAADLNCNTGCNDNGSIIAGAFYGRNAAETSGLMGFDVTTDFEDPNNVGQTIERRFMGGAGFTATK